MDSRNFCAVSMDSRNPCKITFKKLRREEEQNTPPQDAIDVPPSSSSTSSDSDSGSDDETLRTHLQSNELVLYDPATAAANANAADTVHDNAKTLISSTFDHPNNPMSFPWTYPFNHPPRVLPSVGAFTVQCANCFKWRLIPSKEKYEEIREHILEEPFYCETAREWRDLVSCDDPEDITQDGSRLWAIDKPNIAQPPRGWQRLLRIRGEGGTRFADVYYESPTGKKLRSSVEIQKYLLQHPEYMDAGVNMSQFSFVTPKPLQENYVRKRSDNYSKKHTAHLTDSADTPRLLAPGEEINSVACVGPVDGPELQPRRLALPPPEAREPLFDPSVRPTKKRATRTPSSKTYKADPNISMESSPERPDQS